MMKRTILATAFLIAVAFPAAGQSQVSPEKEQAIRKLMELTGAIELGSQFANALMSQLRPVFPEVPESLWDELMKSLNPDEATGMVIPIYDRHFTLAELQGLIDFYMTPLGQQVIRKLPLVAQESVAAGQRWGQLKAEELIRRLAEQGFRPTPL
jgi:uncharacterized protein